MLFETTIFDLVIGFRNVSLNAFFTYTTFFGSTVFGMALSTFLYLREKEKGYIAFSSIIASSLIVYTIKIAVSRSRPPESLRLVQVFSENSFPSGHSAMAFVTATVLGYKTNFSGYILYPIAGLVAFSRLYLGVHYPLDIIVGSFIGYFSARKVIDKRRKLLDFYHKLGKTVAPSGGRSAGLG